MKVVPISPEWTTVRKVEEKHSERFRYKEAL